MRYAITSVLPKGGKAKYIYDFGSTMELTITFKGIVENAYVPGLASHGVMRKDPPAGPPHRQLHRVRFAVWENMAMKILELGISNREQMCYCKIGERACVNSMVEHCSTTEEQQSAGLPVD